MLPALPLAPLTRWPNLSLPQASMAMLSVAYQLALSVAAPSPSSLPSAPAMRASPVGSLRASPPTTAKRFWSDCWASAVGAMAMAPSRAKASFMRFMGDLRYRCFYSWTGHGCDRRGHPIDPFLNGAWACRCGGGREFTVVFAASMRLATCLAL